MWWCTSIVLAVGGVEAKGLLRIKFFFFFSFIDLCLCGLVYGTAHVWRSEGNLLELVLLFHCVVSEFRFGGIAADLRPYCEFKAKHLTQPEI